MRWILLLVAIMALAGLWFAVRKQPTVKRLDGSKITPAEIDGTVTRLMRAAEVTGVGIAIFNNGKAAYLKTYGVRDKEKNLPLTEDSIMTAASFSKAAFGYMVMQSVDQGILNLDKPVYQ
jgi:CubicO group peptidase (beta-lactamase class C family)